MSRRAPSSRAEGWLVWSLRGVGGVEVLAFVAMLMPTGWMTAAHRELGLGALSVTPLFEYLVRTLSALYGVLGLLQIVLSFDPGRYRPIIVFLGWIHLAAGPLVLWLDVRLGLPPYWTWLEGPPIFLVGLVYLALARLLPD